ncbi:MAG: NYN domain-containing protein [Alicyclobacillus sp.]|nr:NYN domain-containing protein [Alicyclobacillus sp.]
MKSSGNGGRKTRLHSKCLVVDGYNVLGRVGEEGLAGVEDLEALRNQLMHDLAEYQAYTGETVVLVFDAHHTAGPERDEQVAGIRVIFTGYQETADDRIERLVYELRDTTRHITVATSDYAEQQVIFGGGALRISASGLLSRLREAKRAIRKETSETVSQAGAPTRISDRIGQDVAKILEKWRRQQ